VTALCCIALSFLFIAHHSSFELQGGGFLLRVKAPVRARLFASNYHFKARCSWFQVVKRDLPYVRQAIGRSNFRSFPVYKVEHSGKEATRLGRNSNNSNTDVVFRKDNVKTLWPR